MPREGKFFFAVKNRSGVSRKEIFGVCLEFWIGGSDRCGRCWRGARSTRPCSGSQKERGGMGELQNGGGRILGFTLRQAIVLALIAYSLLTGMLIVRNFNTSEDLDASQKLLTTLRGEKANVVSNDDVLETVVYDEDDGTDELRNGMYHSLVVFEMNYQDMMSKFKIFIYPGDDYSFKALSEEPRAEERKNTDELFIYQLYQSDFVTLDPEQAHLLLLPVSIRGLIDDPRVGSNRLGKWLSNYVQALRDDYPYWARTLGADHVLVTCNEFHADGTRNTMELNKNAINVACSPLAGQVFYPHKDVAIPLYQEIPLPTADAESQRSTLVYYHGDTDSGSLYASLGLSWETDSLFQFEASDVEPAVHYERLATSKFCLILGPQDYPDIVGALKYGCVPVLVSDGKLYDLPFQDVLNWNQFAVILSQKNAKNAKALLSQVDERQYVNMQYLATQASHHLEWHDPPLAKDALFLTLYDLWMRRHAIRYVRREEL